MVTRGQVMIAGMLVVLVLGTIAAVIVALQVATTEVAVLIGVIGTIVLPVATGFISVIQAMSNSAKIDATKTKVDAIHETVKPLSERLTSGNDGG